MKLKYKVYRGSDGDFYIFRGSRLDSYTYNGDLWNGPLYVDNLAGEIELDTISSIKYWLEITLTAIPTMFLWK